MNEAEYERVLARAVQSLEDLVADLPLLKTYYNPESAFGDRLAGQHVDILSLHTALRGQLERLHQEMRARPRIER